MPFADQIEPIFNCKDLNMIAPINSACLMKKTSPCTKNLISKQSMTNEKLILIAGNKKN